MKYSIKIPPQYLEQVMAIEENDINYDRARRCSDTCAGWGVFNGDAIECCDECERFKDDVEAAAHVFSVLARGEPPTALPMRFVLEEDGDVMGAFDDFDLANELRAGMCSDIRPVIISAWRGLECVRYAVWNAEERIYDRDIDPAATIGPELAVADTFAGTVVWVDNGDSIDDRSLDDAD